MMPGPANATPSDNLLGLLFSHIFHLRTKLREQAYERSLRALLIALGASVLAEAERLSCAFEDRTGLRPTDINAYGGSKLTDKVTNLSGEASTFCPQTRRSSGLASIEPYLPASLVAVADRGQAVLGERKQLARSDRTRGKADGRLATQRNH